LGLAKREGDQNITPPIVYTSKGKVMVLPPNTQQFSLNNLSNTLSTYKGKGSPSSDKGKGSFPSDNESLYGFSRNNEVTSLATASSNPQQTFAVRNPQNNAGRGLPTEVVAALAAAKTGSSPPTGRVRQLAAQVENSVAAVTKTNSQIFRGKKARSLQRRNTAAHVAATRGEHFGFTNDENNDGGVVSHQHNLRKAMRGPNKVRVPGAVNNNSESNNN
jgi:hypothetical protein